MDALLPHFNEDHIPVVESVGCAAGAYLLEHTFVRTLVAVVEEAALAALHASVPEFRHLLRRFAACRTAVLERKPCQVFTAGQNCPTAERP